MNSVLVSNIWTSVGGFAVIIALFLYICKMYLNKFELHEKKSSIAREKLSLSINDRVHRRELDPRLSAISKDLDTYNKEGIEGLKVLRRDNAKQNEVVLKAMEKNDGMIEKLLNKWEIFQEKDQAYKLVMEGRVSKMEETIGNYIVDNFKSKLGGSQL